MDLQSLFYIVAILSLLAWLLIGIFVLLIIWQVKRKIDESVHFVKEKEAQLKGIFSARIATTIGEKIIDFVQTKRKK